MDSDNSKNTKICVGRLFHPSYPGNFQIKETRANMVVGDSGGGGNSDIEVSLRQSLAMGISEDFEFYQYEEHITIVAFGRHDIYFKNGDGVSTNGF